MFNEFKWHRARNRIEHSAYTTVASFFVAEGFCAVFKFTVVRSVFALRRGICSTEEKKLFVSVGRNFICAIPQLTTPLMIWFYLGSKCLGSGCTT